MARVCASCSQPSWPVSRVCVVSISLNFLQIKYDIAGYIISWDALVEWAKCREGNHPALQDIPDEDIDELWISALTVMDKYVREKYSVRIVPVDLLSSEPVIITRRRYAGPVDEMIDETDKDKEVKSCLEKEGLKVSFVRSSILSRRVPSFVVNR